MNAPVPVLFEGRHAATEAYRLLQPVLAGLGDFVVEEKKTSLHIVAGRAAFLGVHPRAGGLRLNIVLGRPLEGPRVVKSEKSSSKVWHNEVDIVGPEDLDAELIVWLTEAYNRVTG